MVMDSEAERELEAVISEEKAKIVLGDEYATLPYDEWVEGLKSFAATQRCPDCGAAYDLDNPEEEMWGWYVEGQDAELEEVEVVQFFCENCVDMDDEEREKQHPKSWGMLIFRRGPTGTFPFDSNDEIRLDDPDEP
jgi:hypothetical protein